MAIIPWQCAHGDAPPITLAAAATVAIAPADDSVDTNAVVIVGAGDIHSFGEGPGGYIVKRVVFRPGDRETITLHDGPSLVLVTRGDRTIRDEAFGSYVCDDEHRWVELYFTATGTASIERVLAALERRIAELEKRLAEADAPGK